MKLDISFEDGWYTITSPDFPGVVTQAQDFYELKKNFLEAVALWVEIEYDKEIRKTRRFNRS